MSIRGENNEPTAQTIAGRAPAPVPGPIAASATVVAPITATATAAREAAFRSTVLPRVEEHQGAPRVVLESKLRYEDLRRLGAGGQAEVTLTRDHDIDRTVAVKRLLPERRDDASVLRFAEEIRTVGQLEHPNIVPIHDVGVDAAGQYFFVMKYVDGETLESIIERLRAGDVKYLRRYSPEYRLQICNEILRGVEHAHSLGILHRDLKPANIMVGSMGEVVIMDWGLAKRLSDGESSAPRLPAPAGERPTESSAPRPTAPTPTDEQPTPRAAAKTSERARLFETQAGALLGTPAYMAPEQAAGRLDAVDARSDVYSLAVTFYEFLSLTHPRQHCGSLAEMIASVIDEPIAPLQVLADFGRGGAPAALGHFVRHGLARDPAARYPTVAAMRERLEAVRDGKAPVECHVTFAQRLLDGLSRAVNRHPGLTLIFFAGVLACVVLAMVMLARALLH